MRPGPVAVPLLRAGNETFGSNETFDELKMPIRNRKASFAFQLKSFPGCSQLCELWVLAAAQARTGSSEVLGWV